MKITKEYIKQLILEQLEEQKKMSAVDYKKQQLKQASKIQSGVQDKERAILAQIESKLIQFAAKRDLSASGRITKLLQMLNAELDKALNK